MTLTPLKDIDHHLQDESPATNFIKTTLESEEIVIFTDSKFRDTFKHISTIMDVLEQKWKPVILESEECKEHKCGIEEVLSKITNNAVPPHLFIKQKYYASGRLIGTLYAHGQLEQTLGLESVVVH